MKWEEIYKENKNRKTEEIIEIISNFSLKTQIKNLWKYHKKMILLTSIIAIILFLVSFHSSINTMIAAFILISLLILSSLFFLSFSIKGKENSMKIQANGEEVIIPYSNIRHIYLEESSDRIFLKKRHYYNLIILYETPKHNICDIRLPVLLLDKEEFKNWLMNFKVKPSNINYQEKCIKYKRKRFLKKFILFLFLLITAIILAYIF